MLQDYPNTQLFINGEWQNSKSNETLEIINPATEEVIGKLSHARKEDLDVKKTISPLLDGKRSRQMLHAHELSIVHPDSSKALFFQGILPYDFSNLLSNLSKYKTSWAFK